MLLTLLFSFAVFVGGHDYGRITLLIGDSVDRFTVQAWCGHHAGNKPKEWGSHSIRYVNKNIAHPPQFCHAPRLNCSLASVHIYGTNSTGPYYGGFINTEEDIYGDTTPRIAKAVELFVLEFGVPDHIVIHTAQWDIRALAAYLGRISAHDNSSLLLREVEIFRRNLGARLDELAILAPSSQLGLRTAAYSMKVENHEMQHDFNGIIRSTAAARRIPLVDLDKDLWANEGFERNNSAAFSRLFRDFIHPRDAFLVAAGDELLNALFSHFSHWPQNSQSSIENSSASPLYSVDEPVQPTGALAWDLFLRRPTLNFRMVHLAASNSSSSSERTWFYTGVINGTRWAWRLGSSQDAATFKAWLRVPDSQVLEIRLPAPGSLPLLRELPMPPLALLTAKAGSPVAVQLSAGQLFLIDFSLGGFKDGGIRHVPSLETLAFFNISPAHVHREPEWEIITQVQDFHENFGVADIFRESALIRYYKEKEFFWVLNKTKHSFSNWAAFVSHGLDTSAVLAVYVKSDMDLLPTGDPVQPKRR
jgi:hypothetical protein